MRLAYLLPNVFLEKDSVLKRGRNLNSLRPKERFPAHTAELDRRMFRSFRLIYQQHGNAVAHGIDPAAAGALQKALIRGQRERLAALRDGAYQRVEQFLQHHHSILMNFLRSNT